MGPRARTDRILVEHRADGLVIYDEEGHKAYRLEPAAATVWERCDGRTSVAEIAQALTASSSLPCDEEVVELALAELDSKRLLETTPHDASGISTVHPASGVAPEPKPEPGPRRVAATWLMHRWRRSRDTEH